MEQIKFETSDTPKVIITSIGGSLRIRGWDRAEFRADADHKDTLSVEQRGDEIRVSCTTGSMLRIPTRSFISIGNVGRELMIKSMEGAVEIGDVAGQVILKNTGDVSLTLTQGNITAKQVEGDLSIKTARGNIVARDVDGILSINKCEGNFNFKGFSGGINAVAKGNAHIVLETEPEASYSIKADGNISCRLSSEVSGKAILNSSAESIRVRSGEIKDVFKLKKYELDLGEGKGEIALNAEGNIDINVIGLDDSFSSDFSLEEDISSLAEEITNQVAEQIESQIDSITGQINQLTSDIDIGAHSSASIRRGLERQKRSMERKLEKTQKRVDIKIRDAAKRNRKTRYAHRHTKEPVSNKERQMVLEMLQNKQISVEQAETLLAALEGRQPDLPSKNQETQD